MTYSKTTCAALTAFCLFVASISAQAQPGLSASGDLATATDSVISENAPVAQAPIDETTITIDSDSSLNAESSSPPSTFWLLVRMILMLALVIVCVYAVVYLMRRSTRRGLNSSDDFLRIVSRVDIAPGKSVQVISLLDEKAFIIGVSDEAVNLIGEINDKEMIQAMNLNADKNESARRPRSFNDILSIFMPGGPRDKNIFEGSGDRVRDALQKQHSRLDGTEE